MNKKLIAIIISILIIVGGASAYYLTQSDNKTPSNQTQQNNDEKPTATWENNVLTYNGKDGVTAGELITQVATTKKDAYGMVASINNVESDSKKNQYWQFLVNGVSSTVGADTYVTKSTDVITWKIASF